MRIGILGTGIVGQTLGTKLVSLGYEVKLGGRSAFNERAASWGEARGAKMILPLWVRLMGTLKSPNFNFIVSRGDG